jgi:NAD(P)-dependent dehydrogenase (short-subunit alcohol dehydrogenase family)
MSTDLSGRVVLVTGGTKGLGAGLVAAFRTAGAEVMLCARNDPPEPDDRFVRADLRNPDDAAAAVAATVDRFGRLDAVVNNAGGSPPSPAADVSPRFFEKVVALNLLAPFYVAQAANAVMQRQPEGGSIINIGSLSGKRPSPGSAAYGAAKAGLANLTITLAMEWGPKVRVNALTVGYLETEQVAMFYGDEEAIDRIARTMPMQRLVRPSDVGNVCIFLASPDAAYVTGADIAVHGGGELPAFLATSASR